MSWRDGKGGDFKSGDTSWHHHCFHAGPLERRYSIKKVTSSHRAQNRSRNWLKLRYNSTCGLNSSWHFTVQFVIKISSLVPCHSQISGSPWITVTPELFPLQHWLLAFGEGDSRTMVDLSLCLRPRGIFGRNQTQRLHAPLTFCQIIFGQIIICQIIILFK